ncbi:MAG TPA: FtsW/RodA/SpoVE family cell cycle protein [Pirellulales bacterium]|nr:FtsW/RodA/SpoVE family cell cycle protein [Pirellulales bacterium]
MFDTRPTIRSLAVNQETWHHSWHDLFCTMLPRAWPQRLPWGLLLAAGALLLVGWCGIARSEELADGEGRLLRHQVLCSLLAGAAVWLAALPGYRVLRDYAYPLFGTTLVLLIAVYFFPASHGAQRWIRLGSIGFQPSEISKLVFVLALARYLMRAENYRHFRGLVAPLALTLVPVVLILREPDLGTALVFFPLLFAMLYAAGARKTHLAALALCGVAMLPVLWSQMSGEQRSRVTALFEQTGPEQAPSDDGYHLHQSKQMLALGGKRGSLWAGDFVLDRAVYQLPEDHTDFIFVVLVERLGWSGALAALLLEFGIVLAAMSIAARTREPFGRLTAIGIGTLFGVEAFINTAMTVGLLPVTGLSLPLLSYGGSGLLTHGVALGLLVNISLRPGFEVGTMPFRFVQRGAAR